ncbi:STAS domain-containing protein [Methylomonas sp. SURF-2]|uniref:Anti-sigma factor antagonist n=1 Tax=Methylomonas subterranea TaxID=2952225 RepID=A0ABT1TE47_9GAMM|nr:STAS domain-containing protein [Methylomonas sp. SURF-2]MCQ8103531.1 STAS domain-containing protein [Methylomonas sp. SURF-2]
MNFNLEKINNFSVLTIQNERIDAHNSAELKEYLLEIIESGENQLIVQLKQVRFIDSSGLGALLFGHKQLAAKSGRFMLANIQPQVLSMFELTRLTRVFEIYADINEVLSNQP